jgi:hypothetical protein
MREGSELIFVAILAGIGANVIGGGGRFRFDFAGLNGLRGIAPEADMCV